MPYSVAPRWTPEDVLLLLNTKIDEDVITRYTQRCPIRLFDLDQMKLVNRAWLFDYILDKIRVAIVAKPSEFKSLSEEYIQKVFRYVILSHRWLGEEINITDLPQWLEAGRIEGKEESQKKLVGFFEAAQDAGYRFVWFDSGCIDQDKGPEVEESIRSMFSWYSYADVCFVHLRDTLRLSQIHGDGWFRRGWTLQELLAPRRLRFFDHNWCRLSTITNTDDHDLDREENRRRVANQLDGKWADDDLGRQIAHGSGIPHSELCLPFKPGANAAPQMFGYLSRRNTTRLEDIAYCLISLLDVHMPIAYGEGDERAFYRLQLACLQDDDSRSILNWKSDSSKAGLSSRWNSMLAKSPAAFNETSNNTRPPYIYFGIFNKPHQVDLSFTINNGRMRIMMCLFELDSPSIAKTMKMETPSGRDELHFRFQIAGVQGELEPRLDTHFTVHGDPDFRWRPDLVVGVYGMYGSVSYGVLLREEHWHPGYRRVSNAKVLQLPHPAAIFKSGVQAQWVSIK